MQKSDKIIYITHGAYSHTGLQREENQDAYGKYPDDDLDLRHARGQLFLIADGMGGHHHGREASDLAIQTILEYYQTSSQPIPLSLKKAIESANQVIYEKTQTSSEIVKMGTTCVALLMTQHAAYVAHVGDSRLYRINENSFEQLTSDHTQVAEMKKHGILTDEEAANHPSKSVLVRALGVKSSVEVDMTEISPLRPGDYYLLCTDGLSRVNQDDIKTVVLNKEPQRACEILAELANQAGGHDNVTVQIVRVHELKREEVISRQRNRKTAQRVHNTALWSLIFALVLAGAAGLYAILSKNFIQNSPADSGEAASSAIESADAAESWMTLAQRLTRAGDLDSALAIYKTILAESPMHLESLNGVQKIASLYKDRGDEYRRDHLYSRALESYRYAVSLMPSNNEIRRLIALTEEYIDNRPQFESTELSDADVSGFRTAEAGADYTLGTEEPIPAAEVAFGGVKNSEWRFPELNASEYRLNDDKITFLSSNSDKKAIFEYPLMDVDLEASVSQVAEDGLFGLIVGYRNQNNAESYYLFSAGRDSLFTLKKIMDDTEQVLLVHEQNSTPRDSVAENYHLKVKSLGPWIMVYNKNRLLKAWIGEDIIDGNVGFFAAPNTEVTFSQIQVSSALTVDDPTEKNEYVQE